MKKFKKVISVCLTTALLISTMSIGAMASSDAKTTSLTYDEQIIQQVE